MLKKYVCFCNFVLSFAIFHVTHSLLAVFTVGYRGARRIFCRGCKAGDHSSNIFLLCVDAVLYTRSNCN